MNAPEERFCPSALIPWVFALVALLGCNALAPHPGLIRKARDLDGSSLTQVSGEAPSAGAVANPVVFLAPDPTDRIHPGGPSSSLSGIDVRGDGTPVTGWRGAVRGRAPPVVELG